MFDRIMCVLVRIKVRGHLVVSIIQLMNLISVHFWTYLKFKVDFHYHRVISRKPYIHGLILATRVTEIFCMHSGIPLFGWMNTGLRGRRIKGFGVEGWQDEQIQTKPFTTRNYTLSERTVSEFSRDIFF